MDWIDLGNIASDAEISESGSEIPEKFWSGMLESAREDQLDRSCKKLRSITQSQGQEEYPTHNKKEEG